MTQKQAILAVLEKQRGDWVPLPAILSACGPGTQIGQYNARIKELRDEGFQIQNRKEIFRDLWGSHVHSWYRLTYRDTGMVRLVKRVVTT